MKKLESLKISYVSDESEPSCSISISLKISEISSIVSSSSTKEGSEKEIDHTFDIQESEDLFKYWTSVCLSFPCTCGFLWLPNETTYNFITIISMTNRSTHIIIIYVEIFLYLII